LNRQGAKDAKEGKVRWPLVAGWGFATERVPKVALSRSFARIAGVPFSGAKPWGFAAALFGKR
jgi:hypothetical protein